MSNALKTSLAALSASSGAAATETVTLSGGDVVVRGLTVLQFVGVVRRFPSIRSTLLGLIGMVGKDVANKHIAEIVDALVDAGPEAIATLIAVAMTAKPDDKAVLVLIADLPDDDLIALLDAVLQLTMPRGIGDFFGKFAALAARLGLTDASSGEEAAA